MYTDVRVKGNWHPRAFHCSRLCVRACVGEHTVKVCKRVWINWVAKLEISISLQLCRVMSVDQRGLREVSVPGLGCKKLFSNAGSFLRSEVGQGNSPAFPDSDLLLPKEDSWQRLRVWKELKIFCSLWNVSDVSFPGREGNGETTRESSRF